MNGFLMHPAGGSNSIRNLWPQSYATQPLSADVKDWLENKLHELICTGQVPIAQAQREIAADWMAAYQKYVGPLPKATPVSVMQKALTLDELPEASPRHSKPMPAASTSAPQASASPERPVYPPAPPDNSVSPPRKRYRKPVSVHRNAEEEA